jgi:hypothetical protein
MTNVRLVGAVAISTISLVAVIWYLRRKNPPKKRTGKLDKSANIFDDVNWLTSWIIISPCSSPVALTLVVSETFDMGSAFVSAINGWDEMCRRLFLESFSFIVAFADLSSFPVRFLGGFSSFFCLPRVMENGNYEALSRRVISY